MHRAYLGLAIIVYLAVMAYYAFRPFKPVSTYDVAPKPPLLENGALHIVPGRALEVERRATAATREALVRSGHMSLEIVLRTDSIEQGGPARILTLSRNALCRNFTLSQEGNALSFRLRTTESDHNALLSNLIVPGAFASSNLMQHVAVTYDGTRLRAYVDGNSTLQALNLRGTFSDWGHNHLLLIGDEPPGGKPWQGWIERFAIYDRALDIEEIALLHEGMAVPDAILKCDFRNASASAETEGVKPMRYRNPFITVDNTQSTLHDCVFNIAGFLPLGALVYLLLPARLERRKVVAAVLVPAMLGLLVSGSIEGAQRFIANRVPSALDVVYNLTGTLLGSLAAWLALSQFRVTAREE